MTTVTARARPRHDERMRDVRWKMGRLAMDDDDDDAGRRTRVAPVTRTTRYSRRLDARTIDARADDG
jgi:hypothetical protein